MTFAEALEQGYKWDDRRTARIGYRIKMSKIPPFSMYHTSITLIDHVYVDLNTQEEVDLANKN